jgi:hypothetical protein
MTVEVVTITDGTQISALTNLLNWNDEYARQYAEADALITQGNQAVSDTQTARDAVLAVACSELSLDPANCSVVCSGSFICRIKDSTDPNNPVMYDPASEMTSAALCKTDDDLNAATSSVASATVTKNRINTLISDLQTKMIATCATVVTKLGKTGVGVASRDSGNIILTITS